jgi:hypothetical protein
MIYFVESAEFYQYMIKLGGRAEAKAKVCRPVCTCRLSTVPNTRLSPPQREELVRGSVSRAPA